MRPYPECVKDSCAVASVLAGERDKASDAKTREFGDPNDRCFRAGQRRRSRQTARASQALESFTWLSALTPLVALAAPASLAAAEHAPAGLGAAQPVLGAGTALQLLLGLVLVLAAIVTVAWLARRALQLRPGMHGQLRVLGGLPVGGRERVVLVQVGATQIVLGVAPGRVQMLHVLEQPLGEPAEAVATSSPAFAGVLRRFTAGRGGEA